MNSAILEESKIHQNLLLLPALSHLHLIQSLAYYVP
jgi:hypothetical protein